MNVQTATVLPYYTHTTHTPTPLRTKKQASKAATWRTIRIAHRRNVPPSLDTSHGSALAASARREIATLAWIQSLRLDVELAGEQTQRLWDVDPLAELQAEP